MPVTIENLGLYCFSGLWVACSLDKAESLIRINEGISHSFVWVSADYVIPITKGKE